MIEFEKPNIKCLEMDNNTNYAKFTCEPLERGYGITIGNSLRRILLSSLPGAAITSVKIDGAAHEFTTIPNVVEDVPEIIVNLKNVRLKFSENEEKVLRIDYKGEGEVTAADIDTDGTVLNFSMNDKCAAGTGRFFESMARAFEMSLDEFSKLSLAAKNVIPITAQCAVFAESEVISLVGEGKPMEEIAAGIELSVAKRCFVMAKKAGVVDSVTLTGGCAKNEGLKQAIEKVLKVKAVELPIDPQLMGALGAAEYARQKGMAR